MAVFAAGLNAEIGKIDKEEVCEGVYYLGGIWGRIVVLVELSVGSMKLFFVESADFFAPIDGRGDWVPIATTWITICDRWEPGKHLEDLSCLWDTA